jgi:hypothetical protein
MMRRFGDIRLFGPQRRIGRSNEQFVIVFIGFYDKDVTERGFSGSLSKLWWSLYGAINRGAIRNSLVLEPVDEKMIDLCGSLFSWHGEMLKFSEISMLSFVA